MTNDECARIETLISARQDGAATPEEVGRIERHLVGCDRCRTTVAAFERVDRQVRRYITATPVPELAAPWRNEPFLLPRERGVRGPGHWRVTVVGLAAIFALLLTASVLAFRPLNPGRQDGNQPQAAVGVAQSTAALAAVAVASTAPTTAPDGSVAAAGVASGAASRVAPGAASRVAPGATAAAAPPAAASGSTAPAAAPAVAPRVAAGSAPPATSGNTSGAAAPAPARPAVGTTNCNPGPDTNAPATPARTAPVVGTARSNAASEAAINPTQSYRLREATALTIDRPDLGWRDSQPRTAAELAAIVAALDCPLPRLAPAPATGGDRFVVLTFRFPDGGVRILSYQTTTQRLGLPEGGGDVQATPELATILAGITTPR